MSVPLSSQTAALHTVIEGRPDHAREYLRRMSGTELVDLHRHLGELTELLAAEHQARGPHAPDQRLEVQR